MLKALTLTPMLNYPLNLSPRLVHRKISAYFSDELSVSNCITSLCTEGYYDGGKVNFAVKYKMSLITGVAKHG